MNKHVDSWHSRSFASCTCHNKNTIGEAGDGKPPHKIHSETESMYGDDDNYDVIGDDCWW